VTPWVWLRAIVGVLAVVAILAAPDWLAVTAYAVLMLNLVWVVYTRRGSRTITGVHDAGVLPRRLSLRVIRIFVAVDLAVIALFVLAR
jgi:hypothetical protein